MQWIGIAKMAPRASSIDRAQSDVRESNVVIVDDDPGVREAVQGLLLSVGLQANAFATAHDCLAYMDSHHTSCLVLDVRLPGINGLDFHDELKRAEIPVPVVFISGYADVGMSVRAMKAGAVEFLSKPFRDQDLLDAIQRGIEQCRKLREKQGATADIKARWTTLTVREREVMARVVRGLRNKAIAVELAISEVTVKAHRGQVMLKMGARSLPDLVRMSDVMDLTNYK
jgi:FixJ family two-component response regulator